MRILRVVLFASLFAAAAAQAGPGVFTGNSPNTMEDAGSVTFVVSRNGSDGAVTVDYATRSGSAVDGREFIGTSGTLSFQDGETSQSITIALIDNETYDGNRTFFVELSNPTGGAVISSYPRTDVDVYDDEPPPSVSINDVSVTEGNSGTTNATFTISITGVARSIDIRMFWDTISFSATEDTDFESTGGSFWFTPSDTEMTVSVPVYGDREVEEDERFKVYIYGGASFTKQYGYCTIVNDDSMLSNLLDLLP